jgi:hypothetical protein
MKRLLAVLIVGAALFVTVVFLRDRKMPEGARPAAPTVSRSVSPSEAVPASTTIPVNSPVADPSAARDKRREIIASMDERRRAQAAASTEQNYGKAIRGLKLPSDREARLRTLMVERTLVAIDAHELVATSNSRDPAEFGKVISAAQKTVMDDIYRDLGPEVFSAVEEMIQLSRALSTIESRYDPAMATDGAPLSPEQIMPFARIIDKNYQDPKTPAEEAINHTFSTDGLAERDREALAEAAAVLTPVQQESFKKYLIEKNQRTAKSNP